MEIEWENSRPDLSPFKYECGYCGAHTGPNRGYRGVQQTYHGGHYVFIYICTNCNQPTYRNLNSEQIPNVVFGNVLIHLPPNIKTAYDEARQCMAVNAYTAATLLCRKILMNVAVEEGESEGRTFVDYVSYLESNNYLPPRGKVWVDQIRKLGNTATHEIRITSEEEAKQALTFVEMLLTFVYEMPGKLAAS